jgi:ribonucleoside-diphosphate reductase alpha chain
MATADTLPEPVLSPNALKTLRARYLRKDMAGEVVETPREMFHRVAAHVAAAERVYGADEQAAEHWATRFYDAMARGVFLPNSPTLMNAGRVMGMLSACFVLPIDDSIEGIFDSVKHTAQIQKAGGGTGFSFDRLRPSGDYIASSGGRTSGPMSFWRVFAEATRAIQQGAFRRGANMGMMSITHPDVLKFINAKNDPAAFENFNVSIKIPSAFMSALRADGRQPLVVVNPHTGREYLLPRRLDVASYELHDLLPAAAAQAPRDDCYSLREVWDMIVLNAWATGEPGLCFIDRVNDDNPTPQLGRIEATNPCGEQPLLDYEACNLGSIDLSKFVVDGRLDEAALRQMVAMGVRFLDDVIEVNNYAIDAIDERCRGNRKIGLGYMGLADALFEMGISYDSDEAMDVARQLAELLQQEATAAGEALAAQRGSFPNYAGSIWQQRSRPMRNASLTTIAPTGTISIIAGCSGGIEPAFALAFYRRVLDGQEMIEVNGPFRRYAQRRGFWSEELGRALASGRRLADLPGIDPAARELFVTAHEVPPQRHVRMQAVFQEFIDGAISKTINLPHEAQPSVVNEVYNLAYDLGCKGVTVYRDRCRQGQPMAVDEPSGSLCPRCHKPLGQESGCVRCPTCGATLCS